MGNNSIAIIEQTKLIWPYPVIGNDPRYLFFKLLKNMDIILIAQR
jgi:hypothetical protein